MEKKLRITIPKYIYDTILSDCEEFHITKNSLFNYIFHFLKNEELPESEKFEGEKSIIQFNLNKHNKEVYYHFLHEQKIFNESEFFRKLTIKYANQPKMKRELFIFQENVKKIKYAIKERFTLMISFQDGKKIQVEPYHIGASALEISNYLFCYNLDEDKFKNFRLCNIQTIYITREKFKDRDLQFINNVIKDFDPFLSQGKEIKVRLTETGEKLYKELKLNRPKLISKNEQIYILQCSEEKAKRYFSYFLDEAEILEPIHLREWFKEKFKSAFSLY